MRILAETRNRKHSRELFKLLRENYEVRNTIKQPGGLLYTYIGKYAPLSTHLLGRKTNKSVKDKERKKKRQRKNGKR